MRTRELMLGLIVTCLGCAASRPATDSPRPAAEPPVAAETEAEAAEPPREPPASETPLAVSEQPVTSPAEGAPTPAPALSERTGTLRVAVDVEATMDGEPTKLNTFQYFLWERLNNFGVRVDSLNPIGSRQYEEFVERRAADQEEREPGALPAELTIRGKQTSTYDGAVFFGEVQAHNFEGRLEVDLLDAAGRVLDTFAFGHSWGKSVARYTKSQVRQQFDQVAQTALVLKLLSHEAIRRRLPPERLAEVDAYVADERGKLLRLLERSPLRDGDVARLLRSLGEAR